MHKSIIIILILILIIYYLYNKNKETFVSLPQENHIPINNIYSYLLSNQQIPITMARVTNTLQQDIYGSTLNVGTNLTAATRLNVTNLRTNNLITTTVSMEESDILKPIIVNNICNSNNECLTQANIDMLNLLENPILNKMYFSDASNCKIFNNLFVIISNVQENKFKILGVTGEKKLIMDTAAKTFFVNNKFGYLYDPQADSDGSNNLGFTIQVPTPNELGFVPSILWVEVYNSSILQIKITDGANFTNEHVYNQINYNLISPNGNITQNLYKLNDQPVWMPMPFNYNTITASKRLILSRSYANVDNFKISGIAFSTNPWNHFHLHSLNIQYNTNKLLSDSRLNFPAMSTNNEIWNTEYSTYRDTRGPTNPSNIIVRIPVINNGRDKILYLVGHNDSWNENMKAVFIFSKSDVQPTIPNTKDLTTATNNDISNNPMIKLDNFTLSFNNPFSRYYNSSVYNRYIGTVIPSNLIISDYIIVGLQLPVSVDGTLTWGTRIKYIGTHDKIPII
jgi:hypothetical protein